MEVSQSRIFNPYLRHQLLQCVLFVAKHITCRNNITKKIPNSLFFDEKRLNFALRKKKGKSSTKLYSFIKFVLVNEVVVFS